METVVLVEVDVDVDVSWSDFCLGLPGRAFFPIEDVEGGLIGDFVLDKLFEVAC